MRAIIMKNIYAQVFCTGDMEELYQLFLLWTLEVAAAGRENISRPHVTSATEGEWVWNEGGKGD